MSGQRTESLGAFCFVMALASYFVSVEGKMTDKQRRLFMAMALLIAAGALGLVSFGNLGENLVYFWDPSQVIEAGEKAFGADIRLGGVVVPGSVEENPDANELTFSVSNGVDTIVVHAKGAPPQMFREGIGVVVEGTMTKAGVFKADQLMVKHSNEYKAPEDGADPSSLYKTVENL